MTYIGGILQRTLDDSLTQEHVSTARTPQHPLERRQALTQDHASNEAEVCASDMARQNVGRLEGELKRVTETKNIDNSVG